MKYVYETHLHTVEASACARTKGEDYIDYMKGLGYSGIIVTDHFFTGNSCVPKNLPWEERVNIYCSGYEHALEKAGTDFTVLFGIEYNFYGDEFLIYGVDKKWLLDNPDLEDRSDRYRIYDKVHEAGGIMIQAHPYRERGYLSEINITPGVSDGVEVYNAANPDEQNARAYMYAKSRGFK
ncbi:MAG: PHP domain-containing protein, partial [Butyrivibrio sp.]|uniref:PHP domain-containing protein n=1 Tax=Butyrivibrio sp. TaxID=28121 RepID=UPI001B5A77E8